MVVSQKAEFHLELSFLKLLIGFAKVLEHKQCLILIEFVYWSLTHLFKFIILQEINFQNCKPVSHLINYFLMPNA